MAVSIERLRHLSQQAVYEPDRGVTDDEAPEPIRGEARETLARVNGARLFYATDEDGELVGFGLMEQGGDRKTVAGALHERIDRAAIADWPKIRLVDGPLSDG